ncbi:uncharacterized protein VTP21DRAFT_11185 [Calcarisporiella thermophila]|uniref:uncharacterized protein n=1 Tax=Calcarisporiella thermophila TaxID=911321 RepID=UPI0037427D5E
MSQQQQKKDPIPTFALQSRLPRLPIPALQSSLSLYLRSLRPLLTPEEYARSEQNVREFLSPSGIGNRLQQRLIDIDRSSPYNWLDDAFWIRKAYFEWRDALLVNSNWFIIFNDEEGSRRLEGNSGFTPYQIRRAARCVMRMIDFKEMIDSQTLPAERLRDGAPICMHQYTQVFGFTRIPQHDCDTLVHAPHPHPARHIIVLVHNRIYRVNVYDENGRPLSDGEVEKQMWAAVRDAEQRGECVPVPLFTSDHRDEWTKNREHLLEIAPDKNRDTLNQIELALFAVALDDYAVGESRPQVVKNVFCGRRGQNRWFDKAITIVADREGKMGCNGEHSPCDALIPALIMDYAMRRVGKTPTDPLPPSVQLPPAHHLEFITNEETRRRLAEAQKRADALIEDSDTDILTFDDYGTDFIKKVAKLSPDAYVQMALQLAFYSLHGTFTATYETASTRQFLHGRTETLRSLSVESRVFCEAMVNGSIDAKEKYRLLQEAVKAHLNYMKLAMSGKGCDRHILGLRLVHRPSLDGEVALFKDPALALSCRFRLSTSGLFAGDMFQGTGFGAVVPDGYGTNYMSGSKVIKFGLESKFSCKETSTARFKEAVRNALRNMAEVCREVNSSGVVSEAKL